MTKKKGHMHGSRIGMHRLAMSMLSWQHKYLSSFEVWRLVSCVTYTHERGV